MFRCENVWWESRYVSVLVWVCRGVCVCVCVGARVCLSVCVSVCEDQSWALSEFFHFFNNKKWFFCILYKVDNLFLHQSYLKMPLPVKLTWQKMQKNHYLLLNKFKYTSSAQLWRGEIGSRKLPDPGCFIKLGESASQRRSELHTGVRGGPRAGHFRYFLCIFFRKYLFLKPIPHNLFLHQSYLKSLPPVKWTYLYRKCKKLSFFIVEQI